MKHLSALLLAATLVSVPTTAQVVLSEINFQPQTTNDDQWIELQNRGTAAVDISQWSLYLSTSANSNYWWGFLPGTVVPGGGFLRVHWFVPVKTTTATDVYTGNLVYHFLFGYGGVPLPQLSGGLGLFNTQSNLRMNDPAIVEDWISWGSNGWKREDLAIANGRWYPGNAVQPSLLKDSIALNEFAQIEPTPASAYFHDATPSPLKSNVSTAGTYSYSTPCSSGTITGPTLGTRSVPVSGNRDFGLTLDPTQGGGNFAVLLISSGIGDVPVGNCRARVDPNAFFTYVVPTTPGTTNIDLPLTNVLPDAAYVQAVVVPTVLSFTDFGFSNALYVRIGN